MPKENIPYKENHSAVHDLAHRLLIEVDHDQLGKHLKDWYRVFVSSHSYSKYENVDYKETSASTFFELLDFVSKLPRAFETDKNKQ